LDYFGFSLKSNAENEKPRLEARSIQATKPGFAPPTTILLLLAG
jgi:hypothetical protein